MKVEATNNKNTGDYDDIARDFYLEGAGDA